MLSHFHLYGEQRSSGVMGRRNGPSGLRDDDDDYKCLMTMTTTTTMMMVIRTYIQQQAPVSLGLVLHCLVTTDGFHRVHWLLRLHRLQLLLLPAVHASSHKQPTTKGTKTDKVMIIKMSIKWTKKAAWPFVETSHIIDALEQTISQINLKKS